MIRYCRVKNFAVVTFLVIQMVNVSYSGLYPMYPCCYCDAQNADRNYQSSSTGFSCNNKQFSYNIQVPPNSSPKSRYSYPYTIDTPPTPSPPTYKNVNYRLQIPAADAPCVLKLGFPFCVNGKTLKQCPYH